MDDPSTPSLTKLTGNDGPSEQPPLDKIAMPDETGRI
jgi:hypothetical protein